LEWYLPARREQPPATPRTIRHELRFVDAFDAILTANSEPVGALPLA